MTRDSSVGETVRAALGQEIKRDPATIELHHALREDLGLNSLDAIELMFHVEREFDLEIPDADLQGLKTVGDIVTYLEARLHGGFAAAAGTPAATRATPSKDAPPRARTRPAAGRAPAKAKAATAKRPSRRPKR